MCVCIANGQRKKSNQYSYGLNDFLIEAQFKQVQKKYNHLIFHCNAIDTQCTQCLILCVSACSCVCMYVHMYVSIYMHVSICLFACVYMFACSYVHVQTDSYMYAHPNHCKVALISLPSKGIFQPGYFSYVLF